MKKVIFTLFSATMLFVSVNAQYCGNSGPSICTPSGTLTQPGLSPTSDSLPSVVNGTQPNTVIQFKNFDTFNFGGQTVTVSSLRVDTLRNLPAGLCWATNKASNTWANQEDGCIKISGTVCDNPGQYKLKIIVTADIGVPIQTDADAAGLKYFVRVINSGDAEVAVDTNQTAAFAKPAGYSASATGCSVGILDNELTISTLNVVPNPFNNKAVVSFYSAKSGVMTERVTNMLGSEVYTRKLDVRAGDNTSSIERNNLPAGVYFYSVTDGKNVATKRIVISE
ncbi:MAG: T9SS type A sorting domain-containing protein [Chitinophagales bacterium]|nr:T9SS type A sorting domain-containing protein [Chitinophagales bacterium]